MKAPAPSALCSDPALNGRFDLGDLVRPAKPGSKAPPLMEILNAMSGMVLILNESRQIVAANKAVSRFFGWTKHPRGLRPGEAIGCAFANEGPDGCGSGTHCKACGALEAILSSLSGHDSVERDYRVRVGGPAGQRSLDLKVTATTLTFRSKRFIVVALEDVSHARKVKLLQRVFFHDVLNTAGCIWGYAQVLAKSQEVGDPVCARLARLSGDLIEEIKAQQDLVAAEGGDLTVQNEAVVVRPLLEELRHAYLQNPVGRDRSIELREVWDGYVMTDRRLLRRVLSNMLTNALEATPQGGAVRMECLDRAPRALFAIHNSMVMPEEVQLQIFQRSFSTKGLPGHGIGTYSMKLLGERYLKGTVDFVSRHPEGTVFRLALPQSVA
ncbi:MAG: histidine kinase [Candidatus Riflebacteria bacterium]|nr:histidine kinase [Candidatus Riflebacteria bacterium]